MVGRVAALCGFTPASCKLSPWRRAADAVIANFTIESILADAGSGSARLIPDSCLVRPSASNANPGIGWPPTP